MNYTTRLSLISLFSSMAVPASALADIRFYVCQKNGIQTHPVSGSSVGKCRDAARLVTAILDALTQTPTDGSCSHLPPAEASPGENQKTHCLVASTTAQLMEKIARLADPKKNAGEIQESWAKFEGNASQQIARAPASASTDIPLAEDATESPDTSEVGYPVDVDSIRRYR